MTDELNKMSKIFTDLLDDKEVRTFDVHGCLDQIGLMTLLAACGGQAFDLRSTEYPLESYALLMKAGDKCWLSVELNFMDYWRVTRWELQPDGEWKATWKGDDIYFSDLSSAVYAASCWMHGEEETNAIFRREVAAR